MKVIDVIKKLQTFDNEHPVVICTDENYRVLRGSETAVIKDIRWESDGHCKIIIDD